MLKVKRCLVVATVALPAGLAVAEPADEPGGLPKRLKRVTRVPALHGINVHKTPMSVGPTADDVALAEHFPQHDLAEVRMLVDAVNFQEAVASSQAMVEAAIDALAFQMQAALHVVAVSLLDVTAPLVLGQERDSRSDANADALIAPKFSVPGPNFAWQEVPIDVPDLRFGRFPAEVPTRMALWWYVKALDAPYAVDKFVCLWTATEILWAASDVKVQQRYTAPCGHGIDACPTCGRSVERLVRGESLRTFLTLRAAVSADDTTEMWKLRQVVHGQDVFTSERLEALTRLGGTLRAAVLVLLKQAMGDPLDQPPVLLASGGPILGTLIAMTGHRPLTDDDIYAVNFLADIADIAESTGPGI